MLGGKSQVRSISNLFTCKGYLHDRKTTTDVLAKPTGDGTPPASDRMIRKSLNVEKETKQKYARDSPTVSNDCCDGCIELREIFTLFQISRVKVL